MPRKIISEKEGFRLTWLEKKRFEQNHKWWHFFFTNTQFIVVESFMKGRSYIRSRMWVTSCRKCDFKKLDIRELWLPGEQIPEDEPDIMAGLELAQTMKELDDLEAKQ